MTSFDIIRNDGRLLYEYIRGSHLYGLNNEDSDVDTSGVYACTRDELFDCHGYKPQVSDARHDNTWFEIGELVRLLLKSNPTVMESLFVPVDKILGQVHPLMQMLIDNREQFISKQCFNPFFGYAKSQIEKARGLNKKIVNPITVRLTPYDFIYTFKGQGSTKFSDWLANRGLYQASGFLCSLQYCLWRVPVSKGFLCDVIGIDVEAISCPFVVEQLNGSCRLARTVGAGNDAECWFPFRHSPAVLFHSSISLATA